MSQHAYYFQLLGTVPAPPVVPPVVVPLRWNMGYPLEMGVYVDDAGQEWQTYNPADAVTYDYGDRPGVEDLGLYRYILFGAQRITLSVPNGTYHVRSRWREIFWQQANKRKQTLALADGTWLYGFVDSYSPDGLPVIVTTTTPVVVSSGQLVLDLVQGLDTPILQALELLPA